MFHNYGHSSSRNKKDFCQVLNKYSTTFSNVAVYFYKITPKPKSLRLTNSYDLF